MNRDMDTLTPLDARNSLLLDTVKSKDAADDRAFSLNDAAHEQKQPLTRGQSPERYLGHRGVEPANPYTTATYNRPLTPSTPYNTQDQSREQLLGSAAPMGHQQPTLPNLGGYGGSYAAYRQPGRGMY